MLARLNSRATLLCAALVAMSGSALAASTVVETRYGPVTYYDPPPVVRYYDVRTTTQYSPPATTTYTTTYYEPATTTYYEPATTYYTPTPTYVVPHTTVVAPRATEDELITQEVADRIALDPRINGTVGIETQDSVVTLSGRVTTPGMARLSTQHAKSVEGVRDVRNDYLRTRVGGTY